jgi:hypothetical protein
MNNSVKTVKRAMRTFIITFFLFNVVTVNAEMVMWVDEDGVKHFSNAGAPQDQSIEIKTEREQKTYDSQRAQQQEVLKRQESLERDASLSEGARLQAEKKEQEAERKIGLKMKDGFNHYSQLSQRWISKGEGKKKAADLCSDIAVSCRTCTPASYNDILSAFEYYEKAERELVSGCQDRRVKYHKPYKGDKYFIVSRCTDQSIAAARNYKLQGDTFLGCSGQVMQANKDKWQQEDLLERVKRVEHAADSASHPKIDPHTGTVYVNTGPGQYVNTQTGGVVTHQGGNQFFDTQSGKIIQID